MMIGPKGMQRESVVKSVGSEPGGSGFESEL